MRVPLSPLLNLLYAYSNCEIHYEASIGPGICILHCAPGIVISAKANIGCNLTLVGGNILGIRENLTGDFVIGDNCYMGAHAVVLGPLTLGDFVKVGASALVLNSFKSKSVLVGVPARNSSEDLEM